jgi:uncharacterized membrane protein
MSDLNPSQKKKMKKWMEKEVSSWVDKRIIFDTQAKEIFDLYSIESDKFKPSKPVNFVKTISLMGAILVGLGLILFVASNWQRIPDFVKTMLLLITTFSTFYAGYYFTFKRKDSFTLGNALLLLASLFFGATLFLIAQIYNVQANSHWLVLVWACSILPLGYFFDLLSVRLLSSSLFFLWDLVFVLTQETGNYFYPLIVFLIFIPFISKKPIHNLPSFLGAGLSSLVALLIGKPFVILVWVLGFLVYYIIKKKPLYLLFSSVLSFFWAISMMFHFGIHYSLFYLIPLGVFFFIAYKEKYLPAFIFNFLGLIIWFIIFVFKFSEDFFSLSNDVLPLIFFMLIGCFIYLVGKIHEKTIFDSFSGFSRIVGVVVIFVSSYFLTHMRLFENSVVLLDIPFFYFTISLFGVCLAFLFMSFLIRSFKGINGVFESVFLWFTIAVSFVAIFLTDYSLLNVVLFNIFFFMGSVSLIFYGFRNSFPSLFNSGIVMFVIFVVSRYFDLFWDLLPRSIFFIVGGIFLIVGSVFLEKQRKKKIKEMKNE